MYSSYASTLSACKRAVDEEAKQALQAVFDSTWRTSCEGQPASPAQVSPTHNDGTADTPSSSSEDGSLSEDPEQADNVADETFEGEAGTESVDASAPSSTDAPGGLTQNWLDNVLGENRSGRAAKSANQQNQTAPLVDENGNPIEGNNVGPRGLD
jgi:hypothetical protein